ncbi:MAG: RecX family transcriptional regulator [Oscillospiraceae bacterium]
MKLSKLTPSTRVKGRYLLYLEDGSLLKVTENEVVEFSLYGGMELPDAALAQLKEAAGASAAKRRAINMLTARPLSRKELIKKLIEKGEEPENAEEAADYAERLGFLNDEEYAHQVVRHYQAKSYGLRKIQDELYRRGVPREFWAGALETAEAPEGKLDDWIARKLKGTEPDRAQLKKVSDGLARRGYSWSDISAALRRYGSDTPED